MPLLSGPGTQRSECVHCACVCVCVCMVVLTCVAFFFRLSNHAYIDVDISTKKVEPHCSRGRFAEVMFPAEARGRDIVGLPIVELVSFGWLLPSTFTSKPCTRTPSRKLPSSASRSNLPAEGPRKHLYKIKKPARGRYPSHRGSFAEGFAGFDT